MVGKLLLVSALSLGAASALAEWVRVAQTGQSVFYIDTSGPDKTGDNVMVWVLRDHASLQYGPSGPYLSSKDQLEVDCASRRIRRLYSADHPLAMGKGKMMRYEHGPMSWNPAAPNTVVGRIVDVACARP